MNSSIQTYTGQQLDLQDPQPEQIDIEDIALGLSRMPRFAGQTRMFYSVAQHSVLVAKHAPREMRLQALLHDATEAYLCDLPKPVKSLCPNYETLEAYLWRVISVRFGVPFELYPAVHRLDQRALVTEQRDLRKHPVSWERNGLKPFGKRIKPWSQQKAYMEFVHKFEKYQRCCQRTAA